ncbi:MAG: bifunctional 4-hydroxy-2-oxoglutarate aldolase/2-dehydro-3-deoxy-phosphogluconate aldolase [Acidimicrobiales bacterium]
MTTPKQVLQRITDIGVVPVVTLGDHTLAEPLADALVGGGLPVVEITLRSPAGVPAIEVLAKRDDVLIGAGSVRSSAEATAAISAGCDFIVSPGFDSSIVDIAAGSGVLGIPGVATATELMRARNLGVDVVKFFPAEAAGGLAALRALAAAFPDVRFIPTGGISGANGRRYLDESFVVAVGGSWMIDDTALAAGDWEAITEAAAEAAHLGEGDRS